MQGTQYAPRESILCMEHFVALQTTFTDQNVLHQVSDKYGPNQLFFAVDTAW